ncbi:MAG TPA: vanadium-dependent haloperoxidase [Chitinophagaceae bacterium]|nr:vanadium-dependent haloperoxidase [Chitinophagaceae bacterium]
MKKVKLLVAIVCLMCMESCKEQPSKADIRILTDQNLLHQNMHQLTEVIIHDVFSPPVASRIYVYTSLAAYEALRFNQPGYPSITTQLSDFGTMPLPEKDKTYNYLLAATKAFFTVAEKITFSADTLNNYQKKVYTDFVSLIDKEIYDRSIAFGEAVGKKILERTTQDNYKQTRGMPKNLGSNEPGKWRPTPPDYLDGGEPWWQKIKPMVAGAQFKCPAPPVYSKDTNSTFYKTVSEVYTIGKNLTEEQKTIARYWDDNPFVIEHAGHLMYGNKKITPVGHWIGIAGIACKMKNLNPVETAQTYVLTSIAIFDSFISCWDDKYKSMLVRPVTVINEWFDHNWQPFLQTPPFPEHPSGHSAISAASATVLTSLFGDGFSFEDTSDLKYIGMKRKFQSFNQAAMEASISRVYGGIHYRTGVDAGAEQGRAIGNYVVNRLKLRE